MTEEDNPLQHRLTKEEFDEFLKECRAKDDTHLVSDIDITFFNRYLELRGVILSQDSVIDKMNHTFENASLMTSRDEIMEDAARYFTVFIKKYATVIDSALKNYYHPGQGLFDMSKEIEAILLRLVEELNSETRYINEAAFGFQCSLYILYCNFRAKMRGKVGDLLVEFEYNKMFNIVDNMEKVKLQDAIECNNVYALTMISLRVTKQYIFSSQRLSRYFEEVGLLTTLTLHITEGGYLNDLHGPPLSMMMDHILAIVHNIAYHSDSKTRQKFDSTKEALINFPTHNNNLRELLIMMSLVYMMDEHELALLSDESNVINTMIRFMKQAVEHHGKVYFISLCQLADGLTKLMNSSNISKIVHKKGALSALVKMLRYKDVKENASAVRCIHALAQDSDARSTLLEFPDLVPAMEYLRKTTSVKLKKIIDDTLKTLRSCSPVSGAFAGISLIAETSKPTEDIALLGQSRSDSKKRLAVRVSQLNCDSHHENQRLVQPVLNFYHLDQSNNMTILVKQEGKEIFTARGKSEKLRPEDEKTIRRHWALLIENVDATHIIMELISRGVFDVDDKREIVGPDFRKKRTEIMLQKLLNAGPGSAFQTFLDVLDISHDFVANKLRE